MRDSPAVFSRKSEMPSSSLRMIPESLKLRVWSKSLASRYRFISRSSLVDTKSTPPTGDSSGGGRWHTKVPPNGPARSGTRPAAIAVEHRVMHPGFQSLGFWYVLEDPSMPVVLQLLWRVDSHCHGELNARTFGPNGLDHQLLAARKSFREHSSESRDLEHCFSGQPQTLRRLVGQELQRQDSHPHQVGPVDPLVALRNHGAHAEQPRSFGRPVARRA